MDIIFNKVKVILKTMEPIKEKMQILENLFHMTGKKFQKCFLKSSSGKLIHHD